MQIDLSIKITQSEFIKKVETLSGENIYKCYQCGKCSAGCPGIADMDKLPSQIIRLVQLGAETEALDSKTIWVCASCFTCSVRCPKGVDLAAIMEALRQIRLRRDVDYVNPLFSLKKIPSELPQIALISTFRKFSS